MEQLDIKLGSVMMSESISELASSLSKAQAKLGAVHKSEQGYGYNYASLPSTIEVSRGPLSDNGLSVTQLVGEMNGKRAKVTTLLLHESGQYLGATAEIELIEMKGCNSAQSQGAVISYMRRYALQAILNMAAEDNDASSEGPKKPAGKPPAKPAASKDDSSEPSSGRASGFGGKR